MPHEIQSTHDEHKTLRWWRSLQLVSVINIGLWCVAAQSDVPQSDYRGAHLVLSAIFVAVCAFRSWWPRIDLERYVIVDSWLSSVFLGRSAATVAEVCFAAQCALVLVEMGEQAGVTWMTSAAPYVVIALASAQVFCWHSVLRRSHLGHAIEESIWALTQKFVGTCLFFIALSAEGTLRTIAIAGAISAALYVAFMFTVDVPMYVRRWRNGHGTDVPDESWAESVRDAVDRRVVTRSWEIWRPEAAWLSLYFSVAVWVSIGVTLAPWRW